MYEWTAESKGPCINGFVQREIEMTQIHEQRSCDSLSSQAQLPGGARAARGGLFSLTPSHLESTSQSAQVLEPWGGGGRSWVEPRPGVGQIQVQNVKHSPTHNLPAAFSWGEVEDERSVKFKF